MTERGAGLPRIALDPTTMLGNSQSSMTGSASGWFGPLYPLSPLAPPQVAGRRFDLQPGYNITARPRQGEPIGFQQLRGFADSYDLLRLIIETRKDQIDRMDWAIRPRKTKRASDETILKISKFFSRPDGEHTFNQWLRMLLEDLFVIDAPTLWKQRSRGGELVALHPLDGATIKRVIDDWGRTPRPYVSETGESVIPTAYQQVLHGYPAIDYTADELIYYPRNPRTNRVYGYSPVEQIIMTVNIALRRQIGQLQYYTDGNIPESLIGVPDTWTPDQIKSFQDYWDLYFTGDTAARRKAKFVPGGVAKTFIQTREPELKNIFDEWLARVCCYAFSVSSQPFISQVNRATAGTQKEQAEEEGLVPVLQWVKDLIDDVIENDLLEPDLEFSWGEDKQIEPDKEAAILNSYTSNAILTRNEARERLGLDPVQVPEADELGFTGGAGFIYLDETKKPPPPVELGIPGLSEKTGDPQAQSEKTDAEEEDEEKDDEKEVEKLLKQEGHDVSDQPRDERGRFGSSGGPSYRERKKQERAAGSQKSTITRDSMGRFKIGGVSKEKLQETASKVGTKVAIASALEATARVARAISPNSITSKAVSSVATGLSRTLLVSSAENVVSTIFRSMGSDAEFSNKAAKIVRRNFNDIILPALQESFGWKLASDGDLSKSDDVTPEEREKIELAMRVTLPRFLDQVVNSLITSLSGTDADSDSVLELETYLDDVLDRVKSELSNLGKSGSADTLVKGLRKVQPLVYDRPAIRKATRAAFLTISKALQTARAGAATVARAALSERLETVSKASRKPSHIADRVAASIDLSSVEEIYIELGEDLSVASVDAGHRTVLQLGARNNSELIGQVSQNAANWAREHAGDLLGKKIMPDGSVIDDKSEKYTITDSTRSIVRKVIASGLENGLSEDDIVTKLVEAGFSDDRARGIAESEVANANSAGTLQGYMDAKNSGLEVMKSWVTVGDEAVDGDICKANEAQGPIPLTSRFQSGHMAPLGHPNCRCSLMAYVGGSEAQLSIDEE